MESASLPISQSLDLFFRELTVLLKNAGGLVLAAFGLPEDVFGGEVALFFALAIPLALAMALGGIFWRRGHRWFEAGMEAIERLVETRREEDLVRDAGAEGLQAVTAGLPSAEPERIQSR